jgi:hypothetical protein
MRIVYCGSFKSFDYAPTLKSEPAGVYVRCKKHAFTIAVSWVGTFKRFETFKTNYSLLFYKVSSRNSKLGFVAVPEGDHGIVLQNTVQMQYLGSNKILPRTLFRVFIAH